MIRCRSTVLVVHTAICLSTLLLCGLPPAAAGEENGAVYTEPCFEFAGRTYRIGLSLDPVGLDYLEIDPRGQGEFRNVLAYSGKPSTLWVGIGGWGTDQPGRPAAVLLKRSPDVVTLAIQGIEFVGFLPATLGRVPPLTADWVFEFREDCFDLSLTWKVKEDIAGLQEAGWALNLDLPYYGDADERRRQSGDVQGFPRWLAWYGDDLGVAAAFRERSTGLTANRWYGNLKSSYIIIHTWWQPGGGQVTWGDYPGGTWRIGFFGGRDELGQAELLYRDLNQTP
ncbi:MAG: hypothetical protein ACM3ZC_06165 [Bacteroidota bacterium]